MDKAPTLADRLYSRFSFMTRMLANAPKRTRIDWQHDPERLAAAEAKRHRRRARPNGSSS